MRKLVPWLVAGMLSLPGPILAQSTLQHAAKVQVKPNQTTTYADALRIWGGLQAGAGGAVQVINIDGTLNINSITVPSGVITFGMWDDNGCSSGQIPKYNGSAWVCDTDIVGGGGGGGTLSSISLVMPSAIFDISPGTLTADGTFTVTFDTQTANYVFAGPTTGAAAAPTFRALVAADLPATVTQTGDNEVITGAWRFTNTVFGDSTTAQQLIHIYKATVQAGLSLEKGDETERWDILANTSGLQIVEATGATVPLTIKATQIGIFDSTPTAGYEVDLTGDLRITGNINLGGYFENSLVPATNDTYNIGGLTLRWANAWVSQINATIFAEETAQLFGGYSIIGKNTGVFVAESLAADTTINLNKDLTVPSWIVIRAHDASGATTPKTEYITLLSKTGACSGSGATLNCEYNVTRDVTTLHGTDPIWPDGTSFLWLGVQGDGRIEMYAYNGIPRIGIFQQGASAAATTEILRLGGLDDMPTMSSVPGRYGIFIGEDDGAYLKYQKQATGSPTGDDEKLIVRGRIEATEGVFGSDASNLVTVSSQGVDVGTGALHAGKTSFASTTAGFWLGNNSGSYDFNLGSNEKYIKWDSTTGTMLIRGTLVADDILSGTITSINISGGTITGSTLQTAANCGTSAGACVKIDTTPAVKWYDSSNTLLGSITGTGIQVSPGTAFAPANSYSFSTTGFGGGDAMYGTYAGGTQRESKLWNHVSTSGWSSVLYLSAGGTNGYAQVRMTGSQDTAGDGQLDLISTDEIWITPGLTITQMLSATRTLFYTDLLFLDNTNNYVGINDATPSYALDVSGTIRATAEIRANSGIKISGPVTLGATGVIGDISYTSGDSTLRHYIGDGSGYHWQIASRAGSADFSLFDINDNTGRVTIWGAVYAGSYAAGGTAGLSATFDPRNCTSMTVTGGIITAKAGC